MNNQITVDLGAISHNLKTIKQAIYPETKIIGVVKANAYGHGLVETARAIWTSGADILAVFDIEEAVSLRVNKIKSPILILGYVSPSEYRRVIDFDLTLSVFDFETAYKLSQEARAQNRWAKIDIAIDTGMNRYGFPTYEAIAQFQKISSLEHLKIEGLHSHFANVGDEEFSQKQLLEMKNILFSFQQTQVMPPMTHMAATEAIFKIGESQFDAVRPGLGLYGYSEFGEDLKPALKLTTKISAIRRVGKGESVGYKRTYIADGPKKIAVLPIGYSDGYPRSLSNKAEVLVTGQRCKVVGLICMNAMTIDVTGIPCALEDEVVLIGEQGKDKIYADELARLAGTNTHEILAELSPAIAREYKM